MKPFFVLLSWRLDIPILIFKSTVFTHYIMIITAQSKQ